MGCHRGWQKREGEKHPWLCTKREREKERKREKERETEREREREREKEGETGAPGQKSFLF